MANAPYGVEILRKISIVWVGRTNVTDDRQTTDGPTMTYSEHELEFTFAKNMKKNNENNIDEHIFRYHKVVNFRDGEHSD